MPAASGIRAGRAFVELFVEDRRLIRGLRTAQARLAAFGGAVRQLGARFALLGAGLAAPLVAATTGFVRTADQLDKMSARTGFSVEALSELGYAAQLSGASLGDLEQGVRVMQRTLAAAAAGEGAAAGAFDRLGLSAQTLAALAPEDQFTAIAEALLGIGDPTERAAAAMRVFGRAGTTLLPMLTDVRSLRAEAQRLGVTMTAGQAKAGAALGDAFDRIRAATSAVSATIGEALAPTLQQLATRILAAVAGLRAWLAQNRGLVVGALTISAALAGLGTGLLAVGLVASGLAAAFGALATAATAAGAVLGAVGAVIGALLTPIGAVVLGVAALGTVVVTQTRAGSQALGMLGADFATLRDDAIAAWEGMADALAAGDLGLAAHIVWAALALEWKRGTAFLLALWDTAVAGFATVFATAWFGIHEVFWTVVHAMADAWDWVVGGMAKLWNDAVGGIAGRLASLLELLGLGEAGIDLRIRQDTASENTEVDQRRVQRSQARDEAITRIADGRQVVVDGIGEDLFASSQRRETEVAQARADLDRAVGQARAGRIDSDRRLAGIEGAPQALPAEFPDLEALRASLDQVPETIAAEGQKLDISGGFNAAAVARLGIGDTAGERTAKASEETAKNTQRMARALEDGDGLVFG